MQRILFTSPSNEKILSGEKCMTARCWKRKPPAKGSHIRACTNYRNNSQFAVLEVLNVWEWDGKLSGEVAEKVTGMELEEIAEAEGFEDWYDFIRAYQDFNPENLLDPTRKNYFIHFKVIQQEVDVEVAPRPPQKTGRPRGITQTKADRMLKIFDFILKADQPVQRGEIERNLDFSLISCLMHQPSVPHNCTLEKLGLVKRIQGERNWILWKPTALGRANAKTIIYSQVKR